MAAVRKLKYQPNHFARSLRQQVSKTVGLLITDILNPFYASIAKGVQDFIYDKGYHLILCNTDEDAEKERTYIQTLRSFQLQGLIVVPMKSTQANIQELTHLPIIEVDRLTNGTGTRAVLVDNVRGARDAVEHLIDLGHRKIALISGDLDVTTGEERLRGYLNALRAANITLDPHWIIESNHTDEGGYSAMAQLLKLKPDNRPTAVFGFNSATTAGAIRCILEKGLRIPTDISVVGFNDSPWAQRMSPPLTVVAQPSYEIGWTAGEMLYRMVTGQALSSDDKVIRLQPKLTVRKSTAVPATYEVVRE